MIAPIDTDPVWDHGIPCIFIKDHHLSPNATCFARDIHHLFILRFFFLPVPPRETREFVWFFSQGMFLASKEAHETPN